MFERFTARARRTVVLAQEEARGLGHDYIGTEHLMLALLQDLESHATDLLAGMGITHEVMKAEVVAITPPGEGSPPGHIPFTPRAKKVLELSLREALALKHKTIESEHILLGLLREGKGMAAQVMEKLGADLGTVRRQVMMRVGAGHTAARTFHRMQGAMGPNMTPGGVDATARAVALAAGAPVGSHHYLQGVLDEEKGLGARALATLGITKEKLELALASLDATGTSDEPPEKGGARRTRLEVEGDVVSVKLQEPDLAARLSLVLGRYTAETWGPELLWKAVQPALDQLAERLERHPPLVSAVPPGAVTGSPVAVYSVTSTPEGLIGNLWTAPLVDEGAVREWLAGWCESVPPVRLPPDEESECSFLTVLVGRTMALAPSEAADTWNVSKFQLGRGGEPAGQPVVPAGDLISFAITDLRSAGPATPG